MEPSKNPRKLSPMVWLGFAVVQSLRAVLGIGWIFLRGIFRMLWYMLRQAGRFFVFLWTHTVVSFQEHNRPVREAVQLVKNAKQEKNASISKKILRLLSIYIFGEYGILRTGFNYILPVVALLFLAAIIRYGLGLEYAISVVCNGEELGIISNESEFEKAEKEVTQRLSTSDTAVDLNFQPSYTLKIVSEDDQYVDAQTLANKLLESSAFSLSQAYGVYVDGEFVGAVENPNAVSERMEQELSEYAATIEAGADEIYFTKEVTFEEGKYLTETVMPVSQMIAKLTEAEEEPGRYVVQSSDTPLLIAIKHHMTLEELEHLNPQLKRSCIEGSLVRVVSEKRFIPIAYTKTLTVTKYIDYSTVEVETSALNLGTKHILSKGEFGEKTSMILVTYIDGVESQRVLLSSAITKKPVPEQIGIGTYTPQPDSTSTVLYGTGEFGWPLNGGFISDPFISDRNHKGLDIAADYGTEIYAAQDGVVEEAGWNSGGYGNLVVIDHDNNYRTFYGHCSSVVAYAGQHVKKGQLIAYVGSTGDSTGNHLHFEVRLNNMCQNPEEYLRVNAD